jgi:pyruvate phosphate dikinase-like enzyme
MCIDNKEKKIISKIEEITGIRLKIDSEVIVDKATKNIRKPTEDGSGPKEIVFKDENGKELARVQNLKDFEEVLLSLNGNVILKQAKNSDFSRWLDAIGEIELADKFKSIEHNFEDAEKLRKIVIDILEEHRYSLNQAHVTNFQRYAREPQTKINRIGEGALGGKARGLTFLAELISKYISDDMFPGLRITVPRSIVLSTDVFDSFIDRNNLSDPNLYHLSDERIASKFMDASLPATIIGDLRSFVRNTRKPLVVRSSGLLEDSLLQPFAGIYASILLPNESWATDLRFQEICNAIKYVYSSTYFEKARTYIKSTPKNIGDEKMAVLLQEVIGNRHGDYFYPTISGVAKSYNYYPSGPCKPEEGIVYLALGLGKAIVDGGSSYCFCPERPSVPMFGTPKDFMKYSQTSFYSLNLKSVYRIVKKNEETSLDKLDVDVAKKHGVLDKIVSTYSIRDDSLYPGMSDEGHLVINFSPIIDYNAIPLAKALNLLLHIGEIALGYPVEIEFAVNLSEDESKESELIILQIRSMLPPGKYHDVDIGKYDPDKDICYSENALGNGIIDSIKDIVYVTSESFDMSNSTRAVNQIRKLNSKLMEEGKPYVLVGPGRWGSADPWLGIPVVWSDIAGAKVIVETPVKQRPIEPSQGSHFFHDMVSSQVGYIITREGKGNIDWGWLGSLSVIEDMDDVRHARVPFQLEIRLDGKCGKAVIRKKSVTNNKKSNKLNRKSG